MTGFRHSAVAVIGAAFALYLAMVPAANAANGEIGLVKLDAKEVAKGYRASELELKTVVNDQDQTIGRIDDFVFDTHGGVFVVVSVGDFVGASGQLVAVPFSSLNLNGPGGNIELPGASREALEKLPVFLYNH